MVWGKCSWCFLALRYTQIFFPHISELYRRGHDGIRGVRKGRGIMTTSSCSKCWNRVPVHTQVSASVAHSAPVWAVWDDLIVRKSLQHNRNIGTLMFKHRKLHVFKNLPNVNQYQSIKLLVFTLKEQTTHKSSCLVPAACIWSPGAWADFNREKKSTLRRSTGVMSPARPAT